jgi:hypothetical protein
MAAAETTYSLSLTIRKHCAGRSHSVSSDVIELPNVAAIESLVEQLLTAVRALPNGALTHNWAGTREGIN